MECLGVEDEPAHRNQDVMTEENSLPSEPRIKSSLSSESVLWYLLSTTFLHFLVHCYLRYIL